MAGAKSDKDREREARLAAKLRENLKRRKAQARASDDAPRTWDEAHNGTATEADEGAPGLPKREPPG